MTHPKSPICCTFVVCCTARSPETLENTAFYLPRVFNVGNPFQIIFWWSVSTCYRRFRPGAARNRLSIIMVYRLHHAMCLSSNCCASSQLSQGFALPNPASCQNQSPRLQANHLAESSRCGVLPKTYSYSVLCLVTICSPSFLIIRGRTGIAEYFRVRIPDIQFFIDHQCFRLFLRKHNFIWGFGHDCG